MAKIKLFGKLRKAASSSILEHQGPDVQSIIEALCQENPDVCELLMVNGNLRPHFLITLNGHDIRLSDGLETKVAEEDTVAIFSPIAGG